MCGNFIGSTWLRNTDEDCGRFECPAGCRSESRSALPELREVLRRARRGEYEAVISGHAVTTLFYVIAKFAGVSTANQTVDNLLSDFSIIGPDKAIFLRARSLAMSDFEDAVVASVAEAARCDYVVTRNMTDFARSPVPATT